MRLSAISENDFRLKELLPGTPPNTMPTQQGSVPTMASQQSGLATGGMNPAQSAQAAIQHNDQKKQLQDQIRQTEKTLIDLRKQLAGLG
jgi:hypothetical protein